MAYGHFYFSDPEPAPSVAVSLASLVAMRAAVKKISALPESAEHLALELAFSVAFSIAQEERDRWEKSGMVFGAGPVVHEDAP